MRAAAPTLRKGSHFRFYEWADGSAMSYCQQITGCSTKRANKPTARIRQWAFPACSLTFPHLNPHNVKRVIPRFKGKQLHLIPPSAVASNIHLISRKHAGFGHTPSSGHLTPTFSFPRPQPPQPPLLLMRRITYTGSVGARGPPVTASFLSQLLTKKDGEGCASSSVNFRDTCRSPGYSCVARLLLGVCYFPPTHPPNKKNSSLHSWMEDHGVCITQR